MEKVGLTLMAIGEWFLVLGARVMGAKIKIKRTTHYDDE